jgi:hypothetical protein
MIGIAHRGMGRLAMACIAWLACAGSAAPAQISLSSGDGPALITVRGELELADAIQFQRRTEGLTRAIVLLESSGGNATAGISIGKAIRQKGFFTVVPGAINCVSACALAWLGGAQRFMSDRATIGFHAAYVGQYGRPRKSSSANALIAEYLSQLELPPQAIAHITGAPPEMMHSYSIDAARRIGIETEIYGPEVITAAVDKAPAPPPSAMQQIAAVDLIGADFPGMPIRNLDAAGCEARCTGDAACAAFTFNKKHAVCFLKASAELAVGYPWAVSGYRARLETSIRRIAMTVRDDTDYPGNDIDRLKRTTFRACLLACSEAHACLAFTFVTGNGECWLKNGIGSAEPSSGLISGTKAP